MKDKKLSKITRTPEVFCADLRKDYKHRHIEVINAVIESNIMNIHAAIVYLVVLAARKLALNTDPTLTETYEKDLGLVQTFMTDYLDIQRRKVSINNSEQKKQEELERVIANQSKII
jgi:hypothetical protein